MKITDHPEITRLQQDLDEILTAWNSIVEPIRLELCAQSAEFNPLRLLPPSETGHSRLLGELLNPYGTHGQGNFFLSSFLELIGAEGSQGRWAVTVELGRIDILLKRLDCEGVVIIENKSNGACDQKNQIYRYWYREIHSRFPRLDYGNPSSRRRFKILYLPVTNEGAPTKQSLQAPEDIGHVRTLYPEVPLTLKKLAFDTEIVEWLENIRIVLKENIRMNAFLQFYIDLWKK